MSHDLKKGSEVGLSFSFDPPVNSKYGNATNLSGILPFALPYGEFVKPLTFEDDAKFETLVKKQALKYSDCFPNDLDDVVQRKVRDYLSVAAVLTPRENITLPECESYSPIGIASFVLDDMVDNEGFGESISYSDVQKVKENFANIISGVYKSFDEIPCPLELMAPMRTVIWDMLSLASKEIENFKDKSKELLHEYNNMMGGYILLKNPELWNGKRATSFTGATQKLLRANEGGFTMSLEYVAVHQGISVSTDIRQDTLFSTMKICFGILSSSMNELLGLQRDLQHEEDNQSGILHRIVTTGVSLQTAFDDALQSHHDMMQDFKVCAKLLREMYVDDQNVTKFIRCLEDALDGQLYGYTIFARYGLKNSKIVNIPS